MGTEAVLGRSHSLFIGEIMKKERTLGMVNVEKEEEKGERDDLS